MIVDIRANDKHLISAQLSRTSTRKVKEFVKNQFQQAQNADESDLKYYVLFFAGGEWRIPKDKVGQMYKAIVHAYSDLTQTTTQGVGTPDG